MKSYGANKRRNYFIDKKFQSEFIVKFCFLVVMASILTGILIYFLNTQTTTVAFDDLRVVVKTTADFILPVTIQILVIVFFLTSIAVATVTLFTSHRIAGPLYKLKMELGKMENLDLTSPVKIRTTDQLQDVAAECETLRKGMNAAISSLKNDVESVKQGMTDVPECSAKNNLNDIITNMDSELGKFKV